MSFIEQAYLELKTIDPSITATEFSTNWLNKCSSYYRSYKTRNRDMTLHALMCFLENLNEKSSLSTPDQNCTERRRESAPFGWSKTAPACWV